MEAHHLTGLKLKLVYDGLTEQFYSDVPDTIATQHFDKGNENIEIDITDYVNGVLAGDVNYGLGIAYSRNLELTNSNNINYVGFFTNNTQTFL
jgi:hypothetical protein